LKNRWNDALSWKVHHERVADSLHTFVRKKTQMERDYFADVGHSRPSGSRPNEFDRDNRERGREDKRGQNQRIERLSSLERFEMAQMIAAGVMKRSEHQDYLLLREEEPSLKTKEAEEELFEPEPDGLERLYDVEVLRAPPPFMQNAVGIVSGTSFNGKSVATDDTLMKVVRNPEGSLVRAAQTAAEMARKRNKATTTTRKDKVHDEKDSKKDNQKSARGIEMLTTSLEEDSFEPVVGDPSANRDYGYHRDDNLREDSRRYQGNRQENAHRYDDRRRNQFAHDSHDRFRDDALTQERQQMREARESLPVWQYRKELVSAVHENAVLVVVGDTGSGKTTQLTQYLLEEGFTKNAPSQHDGRGHRQHLKEFHRIIGCTQPRRVAATSVSKRVAQEVGCRLGDTVGYTIRFEDCTSADTEIKYMTDGMLLRECLVDPDLNAYAVVILDEAHERTLATDVLFGLLKQTVIRRNSKISKNSGALDFRLIVTSATLDADKFSLYFHDCPIFHIPGRTFPVDVLYARLPEPDYLEAALLTVLQIHVSEPPGDVLVFLTGQEEIDTAKRMLEDRIKAMGEGMPVLHVLPVYAALPADQQSLIFQPTPAGSRKCVLATNIAETSITIDGIYYVVDPGFVKQKVYNPRLGMDALIVTPISQAQARQRAGRAGRTGPGTCYRLYTETAYNEEMLPNSVPEIQRTNLATIVLTLKALGIHDVLGFDWMDAPPTPTLVAALQYLFSMDALDDGGNLTNLGTRMAAFPLEPPLSKCLLASMELHCLEPMLSMVAMLSIPPPFYRPTPTPSMAAQGLSRDPEKARRHLNIREGDHLTLLNIFMQWYSLLSSSSSSSHYDDDRDNAPSLDASLDFRARRYNQHAALKWCQRHFIQHRLLMRALDIRRQLDAMVKSIDRIEVKTRNKASFHHRDTRQPNQNTDSVSQHTPESMASEFSSNLSALPKHLSINTKLLMAVTAGFFMHIARRDPHNEGYLTLVDHTSVHIHPSSILHPTKATSALVKSTSPEWVLYHELVMTSREYMRTLSKVDPRWLPLIAPKFFKLNTENNLIKGKLQPLHNRFEKPDDWRLAKRMRPASRPSQAF
jgi:ATP-dependent RNA helicase DHX8/PRP22